MKSNRKKYIIIFLLTIVVIFAGAIVYLLNSINLIAERAIEKHGSKATLTAVRVNGVDISLKNSSCTIASLNIANPTGFEAKSCFYFRKISVDLDILSLNSETLVINKIHILNPGLNLIVNKNNKSNLMIMKDNLSKSISEELSDQGDTDQSYKLHIKELTIDGGELSADILNLKKKYQLKIPVIKMHNLKGNSSEITNQILNKLIKRATEIVKQKGIDYIKDKYGNEAKKIINKEKEKLKDELKNEVKNLIPQH